jgi:hypothetical protein
MHVVEGLHAFIDQYAGTAVNSSILMSQMLCEQFSQPDPGSHLGSVDGSLLKADGQKMPSGSPKTVWVFMQSGSRDAAKKASLLVVDAI